METTTLQDIVDKIDLLTNAVMTNKPVLNMPEASIYTGLAVSYLYKLTSLQDIPHFKPRNKMVYFNREELDQWLQQNRIKSNRQIEQEANNHISNTA